MRIALADPGGRVILATGRAVRPLPPPVWTTPDGRAVRRQRWIRSTPETAPDALVARYGRDLGRAILDGDPDLDPAEMGRPVSPRQGYADAAGRLTRPTWAEVGPDGRAVPIRRAPNVADPDAPIRWAGRLPVEVAARRYAIGRVIQLHPATLAAGAALAAIAAELDGREVARIVAADGGPLVIEADGPPWPALLLGERRDDGRYRVAILGIMAALREVAR